MFETSSRRALVFALVGLLLGGYLFRPVFLAMWESGDLPFSPHAAKAEPESAASGEPVDRRQSPVVAAWPARSATPSAAAIRFRVTPTEWYGWWASDGDPRLYTATVRGPELLLFDLAIPNSGPVPAESLSPLCGPLPGTMAECRAVRARVHVWRDYSDWDHFDVLTGKRAPTTTTRVSAEGASRPTTDAFWIRRDPDSGRQQILGWDCAAHPEKLPLGPVRAGRPDVLYQCFTPSGWLEERWPARFGYERQLVLQDCSADDQCELFFLFDGRLVKLEFGRLGRREGRELARLQLFASAWDMLDRMRFDAVVPPPPVAQITEARVQAAACEAMAATPKTEGATRALTAIDRSAFDDVTLFCRRAAKIGQLLATVSPREADLVLSRAVPALVKLDRIPEDREALFTAWFAALDTSGQRATVRALEASLTYLRALPPFPKGDPRAAMRRERVQTVRQLSQSLDRALSPEQREDIHKVLLSEFQVADDWASAASLFRDRYQRLVSESGAASPGAVDALGELGWAQWRANDLPGIQITAEKLLSAWQGLPDPLPADLPDTGRRRFAQTGFILVFLWRIEAFRDGRFAERQPAIDTVIARMRKALGSQDDHVRGAMFHAQEVVSRVAREDVPVGGGFLYR